MRCATISLTTGSGAGRERESGQVSNRRRRKEGEPLLKNTVWEFLWGIVIFLGILLWLFDW